MIKKKYKYITLRESLNRILKKKSEEDFILLIQVNSAPAGKSKKIYDYCKVNNLRVKYINHKKMKIVFKTSKQNAILKKINNSMFLVQGVDYLTECLEFQNFCKNNDFEKSLTLISIFIRSQEKLFEFTVEEFKNLINNKKKETIKHELCNRIKLPVMLSIIKLIKILKKSIKDDNNKSSKE